MRKILVFLVVMMNLCAEMKVDEVNLELLEVRGDYGIISNNDQFLLGSSGVVVHKFSQDNEMIVSKFSVVDKNDTNARIKFEPFLDLAQNALPSVEIKAQSGDIVKLNYLYKRALIVAPNRNLFDEMVAKFSEIYFIHPDILAAYLDRNFQPNPSKADFKAVCEANSAGIILFVLNGESAFVDCSNFNVIAKFSSTNVSNFDLPFYTQVKNIQTSFWNFGSKYIKNYDEYYRNLLKNE